MTLILAAAAVLIALYAALHPASGLQQTGQAPIVIQSAQPLDGTTKGTSP